MFNEIALELIQLLINTYWGFMNYDWPTIETKGHHRSELKDVPNIEVVKDYVLKHLGFIPVYFFLVVIFGNKDYPGPYRGVEKGLLILYHLLTGATMAEMGRFIPKSSFNTLYNAFYSKQFEWLDTKLDECLAKMFSNVKLRVVCAKNINPDEFKHITMIIDVHDSRATYMNAEISYNLKKSGFRTQVGMDVNGMILFVSKATSCSVNNDDSILDFMNFRQKISKFDVVVLDGIYPLDRVLETNSHLRRENFVTSIKKTKEIKLSTDEKIYNQLHDSFKSSIGSRFAELGHLFHRFNGKSVIRVPDEAVFTVQFKLACVLSNMKKFVTMSKLNHDEHHTFWMQKDFDYNGSTFTKSVYEVLSLDDRRKHKERMEEMQQRFLDLNFIDNEQPSYEVERILAHRDSPRGVLYKVKWKGYNNRYNSWLTSDMFDDESIIEEYIIEEYMSSQ